MKATKLIACLMGMTNWRKDIFPSYKANRSKIIRPLALGVARKYIIDNYEILLIEGIEADDVLGISETDPESYPDWRKIIINEDKDLHQMPV
ncbi:hypothetical protein [Candidatus Enterovibrio escicola]|uniref:hypothetical protein n=1 Tax=Candidatus Enterovibrio escicola TaxID=1927127 RepID=UPI001CC2C3F9|nr:hypothetical protein [Candidatus Enterovibrio escacola]